LSGLEIGAKRGRENGNKSGYSMQGFFFSLIWRMRSQVSLRLLWRLDLILGHIRQNDQKICKKMKLVRKFKTSFISVVAFFNETKKDVFMTIKNEVK
jgi:hypothetical protein